ncbi:MAG: M16 family metallopeptidase [Candidatus Kapaibacterium sp.]
MKRMTSLLLLFAFLFSATAFAQPEIKYNSLSDPLPYNPNVTIGKLANGMVYYIMENHKPENRAELQFVVKAGSLLEEDNQAGLAHFLEHMAFNGTKNFPKTELISFLESTGMRFGADVNASTGWDRTLYLLQVPTEDEKFINDGLQVLEDWAHNISFDAEEIEKERQVIFEEWRVYRGAQDRILRKHLPFYAFNSRYADRLPIGDTSVILNAPRERFVSFYEDWYRPNLAAVIAVGDFDKDEMEKKIKEHFSDWNNPKNERERKEYGIPMHKEKLVSIATEKELTMPMVMVIYKHKKDPQGSYGNYRDNLVNNLVDAMLNDRLNELRMKADPPFLFAGGGTGGFIGDLKAFNLVAALNAGNMMQGYEALLTEGFRAYQHGFTPSELERAKESHIRAMEQTYSERDKIESTNFAGEFVRNFLENEGMPGIEYELGLYKKFIPEITLDEVNSRIKNMIDGGSLVIAFSAPEKDDIKVPDEAQLLAAYDKIKDSKLEAYIDESSDLPLMEKTPTPGTIIDEKEMKELGVTQLTLSNGAKVFLKPTDFQNDEVIMRAWSPGGTSLAPKADYYSAEAAASIVNMGGIGEFKLTTLQKMLTGKVVSVSPFIDELSEGLRGSYSPTDMETFFQLTHMYFTNPRKDSEAFSGYIKRMEEQIKSSKRDPSSVFYDTVRYVMSGYHYTDKPWTKSDLKKIDLDKAFSFYQDRFADASDFNFVFVGNFDMNKMKDFVKTYIASLPKLDRKETWKDMGEKKPMDSFTKEVKKGIEPKSRVYLAINGDFTYNRQNRFELEALNELLRIRLREEIREEKGGVYGIGAMTNTQKYPEGYYQETVVFGTGPEKVDDLIATVKSVFDEARNGGFEDGNVGKIKEIMKREHEVNLKENGYWAGSLQFYLWHNEDPTEIIRKDDYIKSLDKDMLKNAANKYLNMNAFKRFVLYPED